MPNLRHLYLLFIMKKKTDLTFGKAIIIVVLMMLLFALLVVVLVVLPSKYLNYELPDFYSKNSKSYIVLVTNLTSLIILARLYRVNLRKQIRSVDIKLVLLFFVITIIIFINILPLTNPIDFIEKILHKRIIFHKIEHNIISYLGYYGFIKIVVFIPILEELIFRGIFLNQFLKRYSVKQSLLYSSIIFAVFHLKPFAIGFLFLYGLFFGYAYYKTNSLITPILLHMVINFMATITTAQYFELSAGTLSIYILFLGVSIFTILMIFSVVNKGANSIKLDTINLKEKMIYFYSKLW